LASLASFPPICGWLYVPVRHAVLLCVGTLTPVVVSMSLQGKKEKKKSKKEERAERMVKTETGKI